MCRCSFTSLNEVIDKWAEGCLKGILLISLLLIGSCAFQPKTFNVLVQSTEDLNPDAQNKSLSVVLKIYQFRDKEGFEKLSLLDINSNKTDEVLLGQTQLMKQEVVILPAQHQTISVHPKPDTRYLGVIAMFRLPDQQRWKLLFRTQDLKSDDIVKIDRCALFSSSKAVEPLPGQDLSKPMNCPVPISVSPVLNIAPPLAKRPKK